MFSLGHYEVLCVDDTEYTNIKKTWSFHDIDWPGESYDPLLMSRVKSTSTIVYEGEETGERRIVKPWDTVDIHFVCVPFRGWMAKTRDLRDFEHGIVVGARHTGLCWAFPRSVVSPWVSILVQYPKDFQQTGHNCEHGPASLWNAFRHLVQSMPPMNWGCSQDKSEVQLNIRKVFLMFVLPPAEPKI
jgi:hypothetical protein